ncbi:hypothetical protein A3Q56_03997 [Intoshia linei]|uniref:Uncharacterized protein n=1 Tax=Intoshia linei TaxID=1819745 RepID=A0A177B1V4_9BILA|nr:hypothetical protein A3Q56_03997 [Intoshia linei]
MAYYIAIYSILVIAGCFRLCQHAMYLDNQSSIITELISKYVVQSCIYLCIGIEFYGFIGVISKKHACYKVLSKPVAMVILAINVTLNLTLILILYFGNLPIHTNYIIKIVIHSLNCCFGIITCLIGIQIFYLFIKRKNPTYEIIDSTYLSEVHCRKISISMHYIQKLPRFKDTFKINVENRMNVPFFVKIFFLQSIFILINIGFQFSSIAQLIKFLKSMTLDDNQCVYNHLLLYGDVIEIILGFSMISLSSNAIYLRHNVNFY